MYWQVYFHKTVIAAENLLVRVLQRAKSVAHTGSDLFATRPLKYFLHNKITRENIHKRQAEILENFIQLDDDDIMVSAKSWAAHPDRLLSLLSRNLVGRVLPKVKISDSPFSNSAIENLRSQASALYGLEDRESAFLVYAGIISNKAYSGKADTIKILYNTGEIKDLAQASDIFQLHNLTETKKKYFLCFPKDFVLNY
jgi:HD superfamily phosphohydrolase